jgi:DNA-binding response OmpR family regulator
MCGHLRREEVEVSSKVERVRVPETYPRERVEEAARLARRAVVAAVAAMPSVPICPAPVTELRVAELRIDTRLRRQWYGEVEFELTPLHQQLLITMAREPARVFGKDELARLVWRRRWDGRSCAVKIAVSKLRRALVAAGAPSGEFLVVVHGVGWALLPTS